MAGGVFTENLLERKRGTSDAPGKGEKTDQSGPYFKEPETSKTPASDLKKRWLMRELLQISSKKELGGIRKGGQENPDG